MDDAYRRAVEERWQRIEKEAIEQAARWVKNLPGYWGCECHGVSIEELLIIPAVNDDGSPWLVFQWAYDDEVGPSLERIAVPCGERLQDDVRDAYASSVGAASGEGYVFLRGVRLEDRPAEDGCWRASGRPLQDYRLVVDGWHGMLCQVEGTRFTRNDQVSFSPTSKIARGTPAPLRLKISPDELAAVQFPYERVTAPP